MNDLLSRYRYWIAGALALVLVYQIVGLKDKQSIDKQSIPGPVDDEVFQAEIASATTPVLVKFGATWCGPCRVMDKALDEFEASLDSTSPKVKVVRLDVDANPNLASHYEVSSIPQTFVFNHGKVLGHQVGALDVAEIRNWVDDLVK